MVEVIENITWGRRNNIDMRDEKIGGQKTAIIICKLLSKTIYMHNVNQEGNKSQVSIRKSKYKYRLILKMVSYCAR